MRREAEPAIVTCIMGRRVSVALFAITIASVSALSAQRLELDGPIDFSLTLKELSRIARVDSDRAVDHESYVVVDGFVSAALVTRRTDDDFRATIDLIGGEWEALEEVHTHQGRFLVEGDQFRERIFERPPRSPDSEAIIPGRRAVIIGRLLRFEDDQLSGRRIPVLEAQAVRITE